MNNYWFYLHVIVIHRTAYLFEVAVSNLCYIHCSEIQRYVHNPETTSLTTYLNYQLSDPASPYITYWHIANVKCGFMNSLRFF